MWENGLTDVIPCATIKAKERKEGTETKLLWSDISGQKKLHSAKILKISEYMNFKLNMNIN